MSTTESRRRPRGSNRPNPLFRGAGCHHCRSRKVRCDAGKPHCSRCVEQGTTERCIYDEVRKSKLTLQKEENAALKKKIARLERRMAAMQKGQPIPDSDDSDDSDDDPEYWEPEPNVVPHIDAPRAWPNDQPIDILETPILPTKQTETSSQPIPYWDPEAMPTSPGNRGSPSRGTVNYPQGALFGPCGEYQGGRLAQYDAYTGAPSIDASVTVRNRPVPSPPVFGVDLVMDFFRHWKTESAARYHAPVNLAHSGAAYCASAPGSGSELVGNWWEIDDLPCHQRDFLIEIFLPYRKQVGLEIWVPDFLASLHLPPKGRPHPGLMWMIYTFAAYFSGDSELEALVPEFLERARRCLRRGHANGDRLLNCVQGMTLLATLLYLDGKINEGNLEASTACHVAITCGLHKISSPDWCKAAAPPPRSQLRIRQIDYHLGPPASAREHGERIAAFWQLVLVGKLTDYTAASTTGLPAFFRDDGDQRSRVETVFPRPLEDYVNGKASGAPYATLADIFAPRFTPFNPPDVVTTLQVKATALLERAVRLGTMWRDGIDLSFVDPDKYRAEYNTVYTAIRHFRSYLPPIRPTPDEMQLPCTINGLVWERLYPHFITLNAEIQLFYVLGDNDPLAYARCLDSARAVETLISQLTDVEIKQIGVMFGHCFTSALHVLQRELRAKKAIGDQAGIDAVSREQEVVLNALAVLGQTHHLVAVQSARARQTVAVEKHS